MAFFGDDFLLKTETSKKLYNNYAKDMPIFDFHCHLDPKAIYENEAFIDIAQAWLGGDHYKWRIMRTCGVDESLVTGKDATGLEKFKAFASSLKYAVGSPIYHWTHMELKTYFGITEPLTETNAEDVYNKVNALLASDGYKVRDFIKKSNVTAIITTDDPVDTLEWHKKIKEDNTFDVKVLPGFRPDKAINIELDTFKGYIETLGDVAGVSISDLKTLEESMIKRLDHFDENGCKASDHGIAYIPFVKYNRDEVETIFKKALKGDSLTELEMDKYKTYLMEFLGKQYAKRDWVMEIHYGAIRNLNSKMFKNLGPDTGYDAMGMDGKLDNLAPLLNSLSEANGLPKTMVFNINPIDNYPVAVMIGAFQEQGNIQFGTAWWFNDHINGMTAQINTLADVGVLGKFNGMLTDSRSFLSYPRHDYFRRILCNIVGQWIEDGLYNPDINVAGEIIKDICYNNAEQYFRLNQ